MDAGAGAAYTKAMMMRTKSLWSLLAALALLGSGAAAKDYKVGALEIKNPWIPVAPKGAPVAGGYLTIVNTGNETDRLVSGSTPLASRFELHRMTMDQGVMRMRPVTGGLEIKPGETVELRPGSLHVMFVGLKQPLEKGRTIKGTLVFEKAGPVEIEYTVEAQRAAPAAHSGH